MAKVIYSDSFKKEVLSLFSMYGYPYCCAMKDSPYLGRVLYDFSKKNSSVTCAKVGKLYNEWEYLYKNSILDEIEKEISSINCKTATEKRKKENLKGLRDFYINV